MNEMTTDRSLSWLTEIRATILPRSLPLIVAIAIALAGLGSPTFAQTPQSPSSKTKDSSTLSDPSTHQAMRKLISELDDQKVRTLLIEKFSKEIDRTKASQSGLSKFDLVVTVNSTTRSVVALFSDAIKKVPRIPSEIARAWQNFSDQRNGRSWSWLLLSLAVALGLGSLAAVASWQGVGKLLSAKRKPGEVLELTGREAFGFNVMATFMPLAAFVVVAWIANMATNYAASTDYSFVARAIGVFGWIGFAIAVARFALQPTLAEWRACPIANGASEFLVQRIGISALIFNLGFGLAQWMNQFGSPYQATWFGFWVNLVFHGFLLLSIWQARRGISGIVAGSHTLAQSGASRLPLLWPYILLGLVTLHWLLVEAIVATSNVPDNLVMAMAITLSTLATLPLIGHAIQASTLKLLPVSTDIEPALQAAGHATRTGTARVIKVVVAAGLAIALLRLWGFDITELAASTIGGRLARAIVDVIVICGIAYALWEVVRIVVERQIAAEQVALGIDPTATVEAGTEGGGAGARLGTVLPLVKFASQITIVSLALLAILGELGVNVLPILAGAGIVGLAIGFGAQTLVKDVISGVFFLVDDAFRKGEYIETGDVKGTVERISIRSMQLRHHNGPLNTVPYGDIRHVTNFSRDWVVMKLPLRLTYDTDAEKVRKMIKKLGEELKADPALGPLFLQPLKSQGVIQMEDSAMIMRVKFMTKPGDQWGLRRVVFARIRDMFEQNKIKFANREVTVRIADEEAHALNDEELKRVAGSAARTVQDAAG